MYKTVLSWQSRMMQFGSRRPVGPAAVLPQGLGIRHDEHAVPQENEKQVPCAVRLTLVPQGRS